MTSSSIRPALKWNVLGLLVLCLTFFLFSACTKESDDIPTTAESVSSLLNEGWDAFQQGDYSLAISKFEETIKRNVDPQLSIDAYRGLGWTYSRLENYTQAITNFNFVISLEAVRSGKRPVKTMEKVEAHAVADTSAPGINGNWQLSTDEIIISLDKIESYDARNEHNLGAAPAYLIAAGTRSVNLPKTEISNSQGTDIGSALDNSITFEPDSFSIPVATPEEVTSYEKFYIDTQKGIIEIFPRINDLEFINATYTYHEKGYQIDRTDMQFIVLDDSLENLSKTPADETGDLYYANGKFYNKYSPEDETSGGTYLQCDAYAGMASSYLAQGDYASAIASARSVLYINQDLKVLDAENYPYQRTLYDGDNSYNMWDVYKLLAMAYYNSKDYLGAEKCLEIFLSFGDVCDNASSDFYMTILTKISTTPQDEPTGWTSTDLW